MYLQIELKWNALPSAGVWQEAMVKKIISKKERRDKKMFSSKDDEHFLLTGVKAADRKGWVRKQNFCITWLNI